MDLFKKRIKFVSAICPDCNGHLELDSTLETAFCQYCGAQCIVENAPKKSKKPSQLEIVLAFVERQQSLHRQDKQERQRRIIKEEEKRNEHLKKYWWVYTIIIFSLFSLLLLLSILQNNGII